jgi:hypothetical protein
MPTIGTIAKIYNALLRHEEWNIGVVYQPISVFLNPAIKPTVHWLPRRGHGSFLADPFGIATNGTLCIFCEEFDYRTSKGKIVSIELAPGKPVPRSMVSIDLPVHSSYPYIFRHQGEIYCIPETAKAGEISLHKNETFPNVWKKVAVLIRLDFAGRDGTIFQHEGRWWLTFVGGDLSESLFVWYSSDIFGPWIPHAANPVKKDVSSSRPAGTPFVHKGHLYRPAQDCSKTYGGRILLNRIIRLTPTEFEEEIAAVIEPYSDGPYREGLHTVSAVIDAPNITLIDGKRTMFWKYGNIF